MYITTDATNITREGVIFTLRTPVFVVLLSTKGFEERTVIFLNVGGVVRFPQGSRHSLVRGNSFSVCSFDVQLVVNRKIMKKEVRNTV